MRNLAGSSEIVQHDVVNFAAVHYLLTVESDYYAAYSLLFALRQSSRFHRMRRVSWAWKDLGGDVVPGYGYRVEVLRLDDGLLDPGDIERDCMPVHLLDSGAFPSFGPQRML
jgi:hypothetical protein